MSFIACIHIRRHILTHFLLSEFSLCFSLSFFLSFKVELSVDKNGSFYEAKEEEKEEETSSSMAPDNDDDMKKTGAEKIEGETEIEIGEIEDHPSPTLLSVFMAYWRSLVSISLYASTLFISRTARDIMLPLVSLSCGATPTQVFFFQHTYIYIKTVILYVIYLKVFFYLFFYIHI
jgi:hypothetical protein